VKEAMMPYNVKEQIEEKVISEEDVAPGYKIAVSSVNETTSLFVYLPNALLEAFDSPETSPTYKSLGPSWESLRISIALFCK